MLETDYKFNEVHHLTSQVEADSDRVHVKQIFSNDNGGVAVVAFKAGQKLDTHTAPAEVMVCVADGEVEFTVADRRLDLSHGDFFLMGANVPHSVVAKTDSKVMLIKVKP